MEDKIIKMNGGGFRVAFVQSFATEKEFCDYMDNKAWGHLGAKERKELLKSIYKLANGDVGKTGKRKDNQRVRNEGSPDNKGDDIP